MQRIEQEVECRGQIREGTARCRDSEQGDEDE